MRLSEVVEMFLTGAFAVIATITLLALAVHQFAPKCSMPKVKR